MLNLFKKSQSNEIAVLEKNSNIVKQIHESFYTEVDKLLELAKIQEPLDSDNPELLKKHQRLSALGFEKTKEMEAAKVELGRIEEIKYNNQQKQELIAGINYFSQKYPQYKFITEDSVKKICKKYGLVYGTIDKYIGTVPDKNLKQMEDFKIDQNDVCFLRERWYKHLVSLNPTERICYVSKQDSGEELPRTANFPYYDTYSKCNLEIAAPITDFDMTNSEIKNFNIKVIDPVVLQPVVFKDRKHYLIVTAWGQEASDSLVVNERMN